MKNIKKIRYQLGITQQQLADKLGFTKSHISFLEKNDTKTMSKDTAKRISEVLGCSVTYLYGMENFKYEPQTDEERLEIIEFLIDSLESEELRNDYKQKITRKTN